MFHLASPIFGGVSFLSALMMTFPWDFLAACCCCCSLPTAVEAALLAPVASEVDAVAEEEEEDGRENRDWPPMLLFLHVSMLLALSTLPLFRPGEEELIVPKLFFYFCKLQEKGIRR